ncbi:MAG: tRNA pseudouridine(38-40) synthase TruA [Opitutales bacterium]|jgi:tRNA pseudouridine38-40 synthase
MRWKCTVAYDGTQFEGWQSQPSGNTVQDLLENRLRVILGQRTTVYGSGRTDSGVHARGQVFHFDGDWGHSPDKLLRALRTGYPDSIRVYKAEVVADDFHARFCAVGKRYVYQFHEGWADPFDTRWYWSTGNRRLDVGRMNEAAAHLVGLHDFSAFTANPGEERDDDPVKDVRVLKAERCGRKIHLSAEAGGFLYRMVRSLAGCLFAVGIGKLEPGDVARILESRQRTNLIQTAPARGLVLDEVWYEER